MKYKFQVKVALTYQDKNIEVEVELTDEEVAKIKQFVAESTASAVEKDEEDYSPEPSLLLILEEKDEDLFDKFWDVIYPHVFVLMLIDGIDNGFVDKHDNDHFGDYREADFKKLYKMYCDDLELEHSSCCICKIPEAWKQP